MIYVSFVAWGRHAFLALLGGHRANPTAYTDCTTVVGRSVLGDDLSFTFRCKHFSGTFATVRAADGLLLDSRLGPNPRPVSATRLIRPGPRRINAVIRRTGGLVSNRM